MTQSLNSTARRKHRPLVSIIILNWNQLEVTCECLSTLAKLTFTDVEVLVVDQNSRNGEYERLRKRHPWALHIRSEVNLGFTGGNNLGIQRSRGDLILLLNNDTEVPPDFLVPLIDAFSRHPSLGIASPKIRFFNDPQKIQYAGCESINEWTMRGATTGYGEIDEGKFDNEHSTVLAHGAAMMIRRATLEDIGLLGDVFFLYYEEYDFCARARKAGWGIRYVPGSVVLHKESISVGRVSPLKTYFMTRNRLIYLRRNIKGLRKVIAICFVIGVSFPVLVIRHAMRGQFDHITAGMKGICWHLSPRNVLENTYLHSSISEAVECSC